MMGYKLQVNQFTGQSGKALAVDYVKGVTACKVP